MTSTEQIVWRIASTRRPTSNGATLEVYADLLPASDGTAPSPSTPSARSWARTTVVPRHAAIANDHFVFTGKEADEKQTSISASSPIGTGSRHPTTPARDRDLPLLLSGAGAHRPGGFYPGADSTQPRLCAYGAVGIGVEAHPWIRMGDGAVYFTVPQQRRVVFAGSSAMGVRQGHRAELLHGWGTRQSQE